MMSFGVKQVLHLLVLLLTASSLLAQDYSYDERSDKGIETLTERVTLEITPRRTLLESQPQASIAPIAGALIGPLIDVGISVARSGVEKRAKQYIARYACGNSGDMFYESRQAVNLPELTIRRSVTLKDGTRGVRPADALVVVLEPELSSDRFSFRYRLKSVAMTYSKARTKGDFDYLDIQLDVLFRALTIAGTKRDLVNLRALSFTIPSVKPNAPYDPSSLPASSWLPFPPAPQPSTGAGMYDNTGTYEFAIAVTESNPYKIRAENKEQLLENSDNALSALAAKIAALIKTADK